MNPVVRIVTDDGETLNFQLSDVDVSIANGLRRIMLSDIPTVVIKTFPHEENKCNIEINTTRLNNEILKQRLSCIPIHITDLSLPLSQHLVSVDRKNDSNEMEHVTSGDFKIINKATGEPVSLRENNKIFPINTITNQHIDFCRLRPKLTNNMQGEHIKFTASMEIGTAGENGMFNAVSKASYGNTLDVEAAAVAWADKEKELDASGMNAVNIEYEKQNWYLLEAQRHYLPNSFDFIIESVGVYENRNIVKIACDKMNEKLLVIIEELESGNLKITESESTLSNCYDIIINNEDYTIGKVVEYFLYTYHYEGDKTLSFCGFNKRHPHDTHSIIRLAFKEVTTGDVRIMIQEYIRNAVTKSVGVFTSISSNF
jgi:DNA-directed RNA polymerase subunit L